MSMQDEWNLQGTKVLIEQLDFSFVKRCDDPIHLTAILSVLHTDFPGWYNDLETETHMKVIDLLNELGTSTQEATDTFALAINTIYNGHDDPVLSDDLNNTPA